MKGHLLYVTGEKVASVYHIKENPQSYIKPAINRNTWCKNMDIAIKGRDSSRRDKIQTTATSKPI